MVKLSLRALEHRRKNESLLAKLCIVNMRKVIKSELKWLKRASQQIRELKTQRLLKEWLLEARRRRGKLAR